MDSLPLELVSQILTHLPPTDYKSARLTCHAFNDVLAKSTFSVLATFIDPTTAKSTIERIASDLTRRPKAIWSPGCSVPKDLPVAESFLFAMHRALRGTAWPAEEELAAWNFGRTVGMHDLTEEMLRQAMFRWALYLSYVYTGKGEAPQLWVMNSKKWALHQ
ncbi:hypothetical protein TRIATDRAFT_49329 [Trichoderma atroviride IMI 206040]|uniref:F-box domain-containing protein n=1 Tax=Hypocrea atroviridis (strain ATCC 20476 / IMI 206040) TaxID=452589 RepID=G9NK01_HYPAI|nr:uncharacterized protein TRIATDRAFT_49329 [Trichoderma atroviride IMI 206040]EHK49221.1 hypothetical protein TRIATDRAFT_49329 [Trichoderma atroviride IMI 206040]